ncbi:MAG: class I SAM-dependent methyltransferase, partial [Kocuria sp.]|nr:class I SAM-dependent methyltransferase [Kocuria sp.]
MSHETWDARYRKNPRLFSGRPNPTLVSETSHLPAGRRALDVGCGEGADALWLVDHAWDVTALDIAPTALQRAARGESAGAGRVTWLEGDITRDPPPSGPFDLLTMHYIPLLTTDADRVLPGLLETVAPGGTFLFVTHDIR